MGSTDLADIIFKHYEVTKYKNSTSLYVGYFTMAMNKQKFDSLPPDVQAVFEKYGGLEGSKWYARVAMDEVKGPLYEAMEEAGQVWTENEFSPAEYEKLISIAGQPIWDAWVKKMEDAGHPEAGDILNTLLEMIK
jgi:TRAP-type C4-dicarboxylate transport system substrate-binding protein